MTIASEIQRIQGNISDAYNSCAVKGATMPAVQNSAYLADTINSITGGGGGAEGYDLGIGTYWVDNGVAKSPQAGDVSNAFQMITSIVDNGMNNACGFMYNITGVVNLCNLTTVGNNGMNMAFYSCNKITGINLSSLTTLGSNAMAQAFWDCSNLSGDLIFAMTNVESTNAMNYAFVGTNINSASFPNLRYINSYNALQGCFGGIVGSNITSLSMPNLIHVNYAGLQNVCAHCSKLTSINFENLQTVNYSGLSSAFNGCSSLIEAHFNSLTSLSASTSLFMNCYNLTTVSFPSYVNANGDDFSGSFRWCYNLVNVYFNSFANLKWRGAFNYAFQYCNSLENIVFPAINYMNGTCFYEAFTGCTNLKDIYFNALTPTSFVYQNVFSRMLYGVDGCNVHFPASIQSTIGSWSDVTSGFGGTNTTVLFDL